MGSEGRKGRKQGHDTQWENGKEKMRGKGGGKERRRVVKEALKEEGGGRKEGK